MASHDESYPNLAVMLVLKIMLAQQMLFPAQNGAIVPGFINSEQFW